jgi:hypothetical protein
MSVALPPVPQQLPLLRAISWYDGDPARLSPEEMLSRYEAGWRYCGVLAQPSPEESEWIRCLVERFGSTIDDA